MTARRYGGGESLVCVKGRAEAEASGRLGLTVTFLPPPSLDSLPTRQMLPSFLPLAPLFHGPWLLRLAQALSGKGAGQLWAC